MSKFVNKAPERVRAALTALARLARSALAVRLAESPLSARALLLAGLARSAAARRLAPLAASHVLRSALLPGGLFLLFMSLAAFAAVDRPREELPALPDPALLETPLAAPRNVPAGFRAAVARNEYRAYVRPLDPARPRTASAARASAEAAPARTPVPLPDKTPGKASDKAPGRSPDQDQAQSPSTPRQFEKLFAQAAEEYGLPADLLSAVAQEESSWNPYALNIEGKPYFPADKAGAARLLAHNAGAVYDVGLMQINSHWIRKYGINPVKLLDPETNIRFGAWILRGCFEAHGLTWRAVGAYHTGHPERRPERTMNYASRVIQRYEELAAVQ